MGIEVPSSEPAQTFPLPLLKKILVTLDGSSCAEEALPIAIQIAQNTGATITCARIVPPQPDYQHYPRNTVIPPEKVDSREMQEAQQYLQSLATRHSFANVHMSTALLVGNTVEVLIDYAKKHRVDLIVVCSHGSPGMKRWVQGSFAQYLLRQSPIPVLIISQRDAIKHKSQEQQPHAFHILVALDGSMLAETAIIPAAWLSSILSAPDAGRLHLLRVVKPTYFVHDYAEDLVHNINEEVVEQARLYLMNIERLIRRSELKKLRLEVTSAVALHIDVAHTLLCTAASGEWEGNQQISRGYDAIALATHGHSGLHHLIEGNVTEQLLGRTSVPLLVLSHVQPIVT